MAGFRSVAAIALCVLAGCTTDSKGTEQIKLDTRPGGADCVLERQGDAIGRIAGTPGFATIAKDWHDVTVRCSKPGYAQARLRIHAGDAGVKFGTNANPTDFASGAEMGYDEAKLYDVVVHLTLVREARGKSP